MQADRATSIRNRLFLAIAGTSLAATAAYLTIAALVWNEDAGNRHVEFTAASVKTLSAYLRMPMSRLERRLKNEWADRADATGAEAFLRNEPDVAGLTIFRSTDEADRWEPAPGFAVTPDPVPFAKVVARGTAVFGGLGAAGGPSTLKLAVSLPPGKVAVVEFKLDAFVDLLRDQGGLDAYLIDDEGRMIAHPDPASANPELIPLALESASVTGGVLELDGVLGHGVLGYFHPVGLGGLRVIAQSDARVVRKPFTRLAIKSLIFAALIITVAIWIALRLSKSIHSATSHHHHAHHHKKA